MRLVCTSRSTGRVSVGWVPRRRVVEVEWCPVREVDVGSWKCVCPRSYLRGGLKREIE